MTKPRPGRFRRLVLRPLLWGLVLLALVALLAQRLVDTERVRGFLRAELAARLSERLGREVGVGDLHIRLIPLEVEAHDFTIAGTENAPHPRPALAPAREAGPTPFLRVPRLVLEADLFALRRGVIHLERMRVESPEMAILFAPDGSHNLLSPVQQATASESDARRLDLFVARLDVTDGTFLLDQQKVSLSFAAREIAASLEGRGAMHVHGEARGKELIVRLPGATSQALVFDGALTLRRSGLTIDRARALGPQTEVDVTGTCDWRRVSVVRSGQPNGADFPSVAATSRRNKRCVIRGRGRSTGDQLAALGYFHDLSGDIQFDGIFEWRPGSMGWRSEVTASALTLWDRALRDVRGVLAADRQGVRFDVAHAGYAGGTIDGAVVFDRRVTGEPVSVDLRFEGLSLDAVLDDQRIPVPGLASRLDGRIRYQFPRRTPARGNGSGELAFVADPPDDGPPSGLPLPGLVLEGRAPVRIENGVVSSAAISVAGAGQDILASGHYAIESRTGRFAYEITTEDLGRLVDVLPFIDPEGPVAVAGIWPTAGRGVLRGVLRLDRRAADGEDSGQGTGTVASDVEVDLASVEAPALHRALPVRGSLRAEPNGIEDLRIEMGDANAAMLIRGTIPYRDASESPAMLADSEGRLGQDAGAAVLALTIDAVDWPLDAARVWVPFALPLDGPVTGRITFTVVDGVSVGSLDAEARPALLALSARPGTDEPRFLDVDTVRARLAWDADAIRIEHLDVAAPAGILAGSGRVQQGEEGAVDLTLRGTAVRLGAAPIDQLVGLPLDGLAATTLRLGGTWRAPTFDLEVTAPNLRLGRAGGQILREPSRLHVEGDADAVSVSFDLANRLRLAGGGRFSEALRFDLEGTNLGVLGNLAGLDLASLDLGGLDEVRAGRPEASPQGVDVEIAGQVAVVVSERADLGPTSTTAGSWAAWLAGATTEISLGTVRISAAGTLLENRGPMRLRLAGNGIEVQTATLADAASNTLLQLAGSLDWNADSDAAQTSSGSLDLDLQGTLDVHALPPLWAGFDATGELAFRGHVRGRLDAPEIVLDGTLVDARTMLPGELLALEGMRGSLRWTASDWRAGRLSIENLITDFSAGTVRTSGWVDLRAAADASAEPASTRLLELGPVDVPGLDLQLVARDLVLRYPVGWRLAGGADLTVGRDATMEGVRVRGRARLGEARFEQDLPVGFAEVLAGAMARRRVQVVQAGSLLDTIGLEIAIEMPTGLEVHNNLADLSGRADLVLRGTLARPHVLGTVDFEPGGRLAYGSTEYEVDRGRLTFADPLRIDPEVDFAASTRVREYDVGLALSGTLDRLDVGFSSDPPLPDLEVFRLLATGETEGLRQRAAIELPGAEERSTSAAGLLYGQAASVVGDRVGSLFGLDTFRVAPLTSSGDALSRTRITVGKRLSRDLFVTYSTDPSSTEDQRLQVEWQVAHNLLLVLTQNGDDSYAADARWQKSF